MITNKTFTTEIAWREHEDASWAAWQCCLCEKSFPVNTPSYLLFGDIHLCSDCGNKQKNNPDTRESLWQNLDILYRRQAYCYRKGKVPADNLTEHIAKYRSALGLDSGLLREK